MIFSGKNLLSARFFLLLIALLCSGFSTYGQWQRIPGPEGHFPEPLLHRGGFYAPIYAGNFNILRTYPGSIPKAIHPVPPYQYWQLTTDADTLYLTYNESSGIPASHMSRSVDEGNTWMQVFNGPSNAIDHFPWVKNGLLFHRVGYDATNYFLRKSADWGVNWNIVLSLALDEPSFDLENKDSKLFLATSKGVYRSLDAGNSWSPTLSFDPVLTSSIFIAGEKIAVYAGDEYQGTLYLSDDEGQSWQGVPWTAYGGKLHDLFEYQDALYAFSGQPGTYRFWFRSGNGGLDWAPEDRFPLDGPVKAYNDSTLISFPFPGSMLCSQDDGETWLSLNEPLQNYGTNGYPMNEVDWWVSIQDKRLVAGLAHLYHTGNHGAAWHFTNNGLFTGGFSMGDTLIAGNYPFDFNHYFYSTDGGETFDTLSTPAANFDKLIGKVGDHLVAKADYTLFKSGDGGASWDTVGFINRPFFCDTFVLDLNFIPYRVSLQDSIQPLYAGWPYWANPGNVRFYPAQGTVYAFAGDSLYRLADTLWVLNQEGLTSTAVLPAEPYCHAWNDSLTFLGLKDGLYINRNDNSAWVQIYQGDTPDYRVNKVLLHDDYIYIQVEDYGCCNYIFRRPLQSLGERCATGKVLLDLNHNGVADAGDPPMAGAKLELSVAKKIASTDAAGDFCICFQNTPDTLKVRGLAPLANPLPPFRILNADASDQDFLIQFQPGQQDLSVQAVLQQPLITGGTGKVSFTCLNRGATLYNLSLKATLSGQEPGVLFVPAPSAVSGDTLVWEIDSLLSMQTFIVTGEFQLPPTSSGQTIQAVADILPIASDLFPSDNHAEDLAFIKGATGQANFKTVDFTGITEEEAEPGKELVYSIYFRNQELYTASFVRLTDTLDQNLDPGSFQLLATSHPGGFQILENRIVEFLFENIELPNSSSNEAGSQGFVRYSVRTKPQLPLGATVENRASIFFEFSKPLLTNTVLTEVKYPTFTQTTYLSFCEGEYYEGVLLSADTLFADTIHFATFDSVYVVDITVHPVYFTAIDTTLFAGETLFGQPVFSDTALTFGLLSVHGCDSSVVIQVQILSGVQSAPSNNAVWSVYPNPASGSVFIRFLYPQPPGILSIQTPEGRILTATPIVQGDFHEWELPDLPEGTYFIAWKSRNTRLWEKIVLLR